MSDTMIAKETSVDNSVPVARPAPLSYQLANEILARYGSPLYVYRSEVLHQTIQRIARSIPYTRTHFHFASVTNGNIALLQIFKNCGWGLHANTPGDAYLGLKAGFTPQHIVYSGSNLNRQEMEQMLTWNVQTFNLDSLAQVELLCDVYRELGRRTAPLRLGLRVNLPEVTGESRIGLRPAEFKEAVHRAANVDLKISGIHFYRGTGTNSTEAFTRSIAAVLDAAQTIPDWERLDFGGGFGYPYHADRAGFDWEVFGAELTRQLNALRRPIELIIEPGRAAIAGSGTLLARVVSTKWQGAKQIIGLDASIANIAVLSVHGGFREVYALKEFNGKRYVTDLCGNTTYSRDYLARNCELPRLQAGDIIAILDTGAYGYAMSSHFLHRPRPAEVLFEHGAHRLIRRRESFDVLIEHQVFEACA